MGGLLEPLGGVGSAHEDDRRLIARFACRASRSTLLMFVREVERRCFSVAAQCNPRVVVQIFWLSNRSLVQSTVDACRDGFVANSGLCENDIKLWCGGDILPHAK